MSLEKTFGYTPHDGEFEKAANSYLMSVMAFIMGLPLPIVNLIATFIFFLGNRKASFFVRWHTKQALLSQLTIFVMNTVAFSWTMTLLFGENNISNEYIAYIITVVAFNLFEFIATIYTATQTRKGKHIELWFWGPLTSLIVKK